MENPKNQEKPGFSNVRRAARLSIAPMMDWTGRPILSMYNNGLQVAETSRGSNGGRQVLLERKSGV